MSFKQASLQARKLGITYIQRAKGHTIFNVSKYQPNQLMDEDLWADDWQFVYSQQPVKYFTKYPLPGQTLMGRN